uniref:Integrase catalytic domain-containing protein n=1 Tax=Strongyloides venezuelensis TaxID=75913 RepID=A0A0K0FNT4_STRVS
MTSMIQVVDNHITLISNKLNEYLSGLHVKFIKSIPEQHESNGLAERFIGMAKKILHKNNDKPIAEAIMTVNNILNSRIIDGSNTFIIEEDETDRIFVRRGDP